MNEHILSKRLAPLRILVFLLCAMRLGVSADATASTIAPYPYVGTSRSGTFYYTVSGSTVAVYKLEDDGTSTKLWKTQMTYAYPSELFLAEGGEHLVRFVAWPRGQQPTAGDSALVFYKRGKVIKAYSSADLAHGHKYIDTAEGFALGRGKPEFIGRIEDHRIRIGIQNGGEYVFDYDTGEIAAVVRDAPK